MTSEQKNPKKNKDLANQKEILDQSNIEHEDDEILDNLPPQIKKVVEMGFSMQRVSGPIQNPLMSKINEKHIDRILDLSEKEDVNSFKDAQSSKIYSFLYFVISLFFIVFLIVYLVDKDKNLLLNIIEKSAYIIGGFGGGYGLKAYLDNKKKK